MAHDENFPLDQILEEPDELRPAYERLVMHGRPQNRRLGSFSMEDGTTGLLPYDFGKNMAKNDSGSLKRMLDECLAEAQKNAYEKIDLYEAKRKFRTDAGMSNENRRKLELDVDQSCLSIIFRDCELEVGRRFNSNLVAALSASRYSNQDEALMEHGRSVIALVTLLQALVAEDIIIVGLMLNTLKKMDVFLPPKDASYITAILKGEFNLSEDFYEKAKNFADHIQSSEILEMPVILMEFLNSQVKQVEVATSSTRRIQLPPANRLALPARSSFIQRLAQPSTTRSGRLYNTSNNNNNVRRLPL